MEQATSKLKTSVEDNTSPDSTKSEKVYEEKQFKGDWLHEKHILGMSFFPNKNNFMWTSSYEANDPSEDRYASLVNIILRNQDDGQNYFIRMSMWAVLDGHGGGAVATYASQFLLPHIAVNVSRALESQIISRGEFTVNGEIQDVEVIDFENVLRGHHNKTSSIVDKYISKRSKRQRSDRSSDLSKEDVANLVRAASTVIGSSYKSPELGPRRNFENQNFHRISDTDSDVENEEFSISRSVIPPCTPSEEKAGTHSKKEVDAVRRAIHDSFLEFDDSWINSIDSEKEQKTCIHGGEWNVGACALVNCIIQRVDVQANFDTCDCNPQWSLKKRKLSITETAENDNQVNFRSYDAMLYTAHCGDCRSVLGVHRSASEDKSSYDSAISDSESDDCSLSSDEDSYSSDSLSSDDEDFDFSGFPSQHCSTRSKYLRCRPGFNSIPAEEYATDSTSSSYQISNANRIPFKLRSIDLTTDHNPYNPNEVELVLKRCRNDPMAISSPINGGVKRVAGTLAITRALGDAYLKTPRYSFPPFKRYAPYITAMPEISNRILEREENGDLSDRILIMATDGLWEQASGRDAIQWVQTFFAKEQQSNICTEPKNRFQRWNDELKYCSLSTPQTPSDYIIQSALNRIIRSKNIASLRSLMALKKGRARRSKHDDITASVIDLAGFVL